ncbi:MAG: dihydroneopterin aldolase [Sulfurimonas sp.]|nr:dihydroneopterin aldolase [Sulfurimonas sp.]
MTIHIQDLKLQCIIGILDFEREQTQDVIINFTCQYNYKNEYINYVDIVNLLKKTMIVNKFKLIEDAILSLKSEIKKNLPLINSYTIEITKPSILNDCRVSISNNHTFNS